MDVRPKDHLTVCKAQESPLEAPQGGRFGSREAASVGGTNVVPFGRPLALVAYLSDFSAVDGVGHLFAQAARLDASPYARCGIARRYIERVAGRHVAHG